MRSAWLPAKPKTEATTKRARDWLTADAASMSNIARQTIRPTVGWPSACDKIIPVDGGLELASTKHFKRGDHVSWNSEAGRVRGRITRVVTSEIEFKGYTVRASKDEPQYEIKSDTTDHLAMHKGAALTRLSD